MSSVDVAEFANFLKERILALPARAQEIIDAEDIEDAVKIIIKFATTTRINSFCKENDVAQFKLSSIREELEEELLAICEEIRSNKDDDEEEESEEFKSVDDMEISDTPTPVKKTLVKNVAKLEDDEEIVTPKKTEKPSRKKLTTVKTTEEKNGKRGKAAIPMIDGKVDYKEMGLDPEIIENLVEAINAVTESQPMDAVPKIYASTSNGFMGKTNLTYKVLNVKLSSHAIAIKLEFSGNNGEKEITKAMPIKKFANKKIAGKKETRLIASSAFDIDKIEKDSLPEGIMNIIKSFQKYDLMFEEDAKGIWTPEMTNVLNTDFVYKLSAMKTEGYMDTTRNLPLGPFKYYYNPEESKEYKYRQIDYQTLFSYLRFGGKAFSKTTLDSAMKSIYKHRTAIIYHDAVKDNLETYWKDAKKQIEKLYKDNPSKVNGIWKSILNSNQCANIILRGYPSTTAFDNMMKSLLSNLDTKLLMTSELWKISFIFSPFGVVINKAPKKDITKFHKAAMNEAVEQATLECLDYKKCQWAAGVIEEYEGDEETLLLSYLKIKDNHIFEPPGKGDKNSSEEEESGK